MCYSFYNLSSSCLLFTYLDTSLFTFNPGEKENFFIDPQQNQNQFLVYDKRCQLYEQKIMNPNVKRLGDIFDFNFPWHS